MIWLFHRHGEYLSFEARTCMEDAGFELVIARPDRVDREWYRTKSSSRVDGGM